MRGALKLRHAEDADTTRSGAGRGRGRGDVDAGEPPARPRVRSHAESDGVLADRRLRDITIPSRINVGWWHGAPRYQPFFEATITAAEPTLG